MYLAGLCLCISVNLPRRFLVHGCQGSLLMVEALPRMANSPPEWLGLVAEVVLTSLGKAVESAEILKNSKTYAHQCT